MSAAAPSQPPPPLTTLKGCAQALPPHLAALLNHSAAAAAQASAAVAPWLRLWQKARARELELLKLVDARQVGSSCVPCVPLPLAGHGWPALGLH